LVLIREFQGKCGAEEFYGSARYAQEHDVTGRSYNAEWEYDVTEFMEGSA